jgi:hypothetical protein
VDSSGSEGRRTEGEFVRKGNRGKFPGKLVED